MAIVKIFTVALLYVAVMTCHSAEQQHNESDRVRISAFFDLSRNHIDISISVEAPINLTTRHLSLDECNTSLEHIHIIRLNDSNADRSYCITTVTKNNITGRIATVAIGDAMVINVARHHSGANYILDINCLHPLNSVQWNGTEHHNSVLNIAVTNGDLNWTTDNPTGDRNLAGNLTCSATNESTGMITSAESTITTTTTSSQAHGNPETPTDTSSSKADVIIGGSVASGIVILIVVVLVVVFTFRKRRREIDNSPKSSASAAENRLYSNDRPAVAPVPSYGTAVYEDVDHNSHDYYSVCQEPSFYHVLEKPETSSCQQQETQGMITPQVSPELYAEIIRPAGTSNTATAPDSSPQKVILVENELYHSHDVLPTK